MSVKVKKEKGYFYIRKLKSGFSVYYEFLDLNKKIVQLKLSDHQWSYYGFSKSMSFEEARDRVRTLNRERKAIKSKLKAENRVEVETLVYNNLFRQEQVDQFYQYLLKNSMGTDAHIEKLKCHFIFIQKMITELKLVPSEYSTNRKVIYRYFINKKISISYSNKIISLLNKWGLYVSQESGHFYQSVLKPKNNERYRIEEAQDTKIGQNSIKGVRTASAPLTKELLLSVKHKFKNQKFYNWLFISLWLGLRPNEVESLKHTCNVFDEIGPNKKRIKVLNIVQTKLSGTNNRKTKRIPLIFSEQLTALEIVQQRNFEKPHPKTVRKYLGDEYTLYAGRKGFLDLMLALGQKLEHVSQWLGHQNLNTTWKYYKRKDLVEYTPVEKQKLTN